MGMLENTRGLPVQITRYHQPTTILMMEVEDFTDSEGCSSDKIMISDDGVTDGWCPPPIINNACWLQVVMCWAGLLWAWA